MNLRIHLEKSFLKKNNIPSLSYSNNTHAYLLSFKVIQNIEFYFSSEFINPKSQQQNKTIEKWHGQFWNYNQYIRCSEVINSWDMF